MRSTAPRLYPAPLPPNGPRDSLDGAGDPAGYPAAIEAAGLRDDLLAVDGAAVDVRGHHRNCAGDRPGSREWVSGRSRAAFGATRHVERAQRGYRLPSLSRGSSSGQPLAASLARTRSMSSGVGGSSVIWVVSTPISTGSILPWSISSCATALTSSSVSRRLSSANSGTRSGPGTPSG